MLPLFDRGQRRGPQSFRTRRSSSSLCILRYRVVARLAKMKGLPASGRFHRYRPAIEIVVKLNELVERRRKDCATMILRKGPPIKCRQEGLQMTVSRR